MQSRSQQQESPLSKELKVDTPDQEVQQGDPRRPLRNAPDADCGCSRLKCVTAVLVLVSSSLLVATIRLGMHHVTTQTACGGSEKNCTEIQNKVECLEKAVREAERGRKCPPHWTFISEKCFYFSNEKKTKEKSDRFCAANGAKLATVKENDVILQLHVKNLNSMYWVGLTQKTEVHDQFAVTVWTWSDGTSQSFPGLKSGHCGALNRSIIFAPCDSPLRWICSKGTAESDLYEKMRNC